MAGRASRNKGSSYERRISSILDSHFRGHEFRRVPLSGAWDKVKFPGDIYSKKFVALSIECKNHKKIDLRPWIKQSRFDAERSGKDYCVIFHINKNKLFPKGEDFICIEKDMFDFYTAGEIELCDHTSDTRWSLDSWLVDNILINFEGKDYVITKLSIFLEVMVKRRITNPIWHAIKEIIKK